MPFPPGMTPRARREFLRKISDLQADIAAGKGTWWQELQRLYYQGPLGTGVGGNLRHPPLPPNLQALGARPDEIKWNAGKSRFRIRGQEYDISGNPIGASGGR